MTKTMLTVNGIQEGILNNIENVLADSWSNEDVSAVWNEGNEVSPETFTPFFDSLKILNILPKEVSVRVVGTFVEDVFVAEEVVLKENGSTNPLLTLPVETLFSQNEDGDYKGLKKEGFAPLVEKIVPFTDSFDELVENVLDEMNLYLLTNYEAGFDDSNSTVDVSDVPSLFMDLQAEGILPNHGYTLQYTVEDNEGSYEDMATRFIVFNYRTPLLVIPFDSVMDENDDSYSGIKREGMKEIVKVALI
ncbi:hypothetical protein ACFYKX_11655 [Cytobacillus sp. FJAT-54145]|uniref:Uncharacterized protein n=1 Tax=Cytobacillus spartinae TaxID=3299023 RepID=A0ABW6KDP8_9BACI